VESTAESILDANEGKTLDLLWRIFAAFQLKKPTLKV